MRKRIFILLLMTFVFVPFMHAKADPVNYLSNIINYTEVGIVNEELPSSEDLDAYVAARKTDFEQALTDAGVDKTKEGNIDYNTLFGTIDGGSTYTHNYAVVKDVTSKYAMIEGNLTQVYTITYDKYRVYKVTESATTKNISTIDIALEKPVAGTTVNKIEDTSVVCLDPNGCYTQDNLPTVTTTETNVTMMALFVNAANFVTDHYEYDMFEGEIGRDNDVLVYISLSTKNGYKIKSDAVINVNGEEPETVFPVIENNEVVGLVAKIKPQVKTKTYTLEDDFGNTISFVDDEGIVFAFSSTNLNLITDEELEAAGVTREQLDELIKNIQEAVKNYGTLINPYQFNLTDGNVDIHETQSKFKIRIKMTDEMKKYNKFYIIYVDDDNNIETPIELTVNGDYLEGELNHLSGYALVGKVVEQQEQEQNQGQDQSQEQKSTPSVNPPTGDDIFKFVILFAASVIGLSLVFINKKKFN